MSEPGTCAYPDCLPNNDRLCMSLVSHGSAKWSALPCGTDAPGHLYGQQGLTRIHCYTRSNRRYSPK